MAVRFRDDDYEYIQPKILKFIRVLKGMIMGLRLNFWMGAFAIGNPIEVTRIGEHSIRLI